VQPCREYEKSKKKTGGIKGGGTLKKLKIYKQNGVYVIERVNQFNHAIKRFFDGVEALSEGLESYLPVIEEYEIEASEEIWGFIINYLRSEQIEEKNR
jgi:hypothetical protein